jgi:endonuclease YncB( thermonuclease family)
VLALGLFAALFLAPGSPPARATVESLVYINGRPTRVYFNDGDSFRQLDGPWAGQGSRLGGFNTLESYGPVHSWGEWHPFELYVIAKKATHLGRHGVWHCSTDGSQDTYGRVLLDCPDLAVAQIRHGYAHAMQIDDTPARPAYLRAQQDAIRHRRGMWAHGVPGFIVTSLHSANEDPTRDSHYNRMVSTRDGHTEKWRHTENYPECSTQCATEIRADEEKVRQMARALREDPELRDVLRNVPNLLLIEAVDRYARLGELPEYTAEDAAALLEPKLRMARESGRLGETREVRGACMVYADFRRRYGRDRAACLRRHGSWPPHMQEARSGR